MITSPQKPADLRGFTGARAREACHRLTGREAGQ
jgi:hypothetical protein